MSTHIFGIRHHGPGSSRSLLKALAVLEPDIVLIEGPADAAALLPYLKEETLVPPVAMLMYNPKLLNQAAYFPFADFSPEWQAIKYAFAADVPVEFMDLPQGIHFGMDIAERENLQLSVLPEETEKPSLTSEQKRINADPLGYLASLAGYEDSERWWEITFETQVASADTFPALLTLMTELRAELSGGTPRRELLREAHMRKTIRAAQKKGFSKIAVVCGAWHAPALDQLDAYKASSDNKLLRGLKKIKLTATWIPWTYDRLAIRSGYRAGVVSPAWYQLLFHQPEEVVMRWMSTVAQLFRAEDMDASSASVIEAVRLSNTLATLRGRALPGIDELQEAAVAILCEGYAARMDLIADKLIIGERIGAVPTSIPQIPLQKDLEKKIKSAFLGKHWQQTEVVEKTLDLRKSKQILASQLLHRMNLIKIPWGKPLKVTKGSNAGAFQEKWKLKWLPDFVLNIIEAGMWGNTVEVAAVNKVSQKIKSIQDLPALTELIEAAFNADLIAVFEPLIVRLQDISVLTEDVTQLMDAMPALVNTYRYGSTRGVDISALEQVIQQLIPRICIALPNTCMGMEVEVARDLFDKIQQLNRSIGLLNDTALSERWLDTLGTMATITSINDLLRGACTRILFDREVYDLNTTATKMLYALSPASEITRAAYWLEGFLHGSGLLLVHNPRLWNILDSWVDTLTTDYFQELLPLLRRTFADFSHPERRKMLALARRGNIETPTGEKEMPLSIKRAHTVLPTLHLVLGRATAK